MGAPDLTARTIHPDYPGERTDLWAHAWTPQHGAWVTERARLTDLLDAAETTPATLTPSEVRRIDSQIATLSSLITADVATWTRDAWADHHLTAAKGA